MPLPLVNQDTGQIDPLAVAERAELRAAREYGSPNFPPAYLRLATQWCEDRARLERFDWRRSRGLPSDEPATAVTLPSWGSSGDSFARA